MRPLTKEEYETLPHVILVRSYELGIVQLCRDGGLEKKEPILGLERRIHAIGWPPRG